MRPRQAQRQPLHDETEERRGCDHAQRGQARTQETDTGVTREQERHEERPHRRPSDQELQPDPAPHHAGIVARRGGGG